MNVVEPFAMIALLVLAGCGDQEHSSQGPRGDEHPAAEGAEARRTGPGESPEHVARGDADAAPPPATREAVWTCEPLAVCGCWMECARFEALDAPADPPPFRSEDGRLWERRRDCTTLSGRETCRRVCASDAPDASCWDGLVPQGGEECTGSCPPTEAPFHCESSPSGCVRVDHPNRRR
jgi:hypothetical protein